MSVCEPRRDAQIAPEPAASGRDADDAALAELFEYAGMRAEEAVHRWKEMRRRAGLGLDAYGGAAVVMFVDDRKLLNALKRIGAVKKGVFPGEWDVVRTWAHDGQECGVDHAMADVVVDILNAGLKGRARAHVNSWWS